jgi:high-affinity iron transporter
LTGAFDGQAEQIFEGSVMLAAAVLLTTLILWLNKGESRQAIEARAGAQAASATPWLGIFLLVLTAVLREGVEAVLFLSGILRDAGVAGLAGALGGLVLAAATGWLLFIGGKKLPIRGFFTATNLLLVLFAAGMVSLALGEFHEAGLVPPLVEHVWDLNPPVADGAYPWWHDHGAVGDFLRGLFGYTADPSLVQILAWLAYLVLAGGFVLAARRRKPAGAGKAAG